MAVSETPGHEARDIDARRIATLGVGLVVLVAITFVVMAWTFDYFADRETRRQPAGVTLMSRPELRFPPEPRLQVSAREDLKRLRAEEDALLEGYGWMDREKGEVRIPIEKAMELVVERGLPARIASPEESGQ